VVVHSLFDAFLERQRGRFVLFLPAFLAAGMLVYFGRTTEPSLSWSIAAFVCSAGMVAGLWRRPLPRAPALCAAWATAGFALACLATSRAPPWPVLPRHAVYVSGRIASVDILPEGRRITIAAAVLDGAMPLARAIRIRLRNTDPAVLAPGDTVRVRALLKAPSPPDYPGGWDTQRDAFFAGLAGYGFAIGPAEPLAGSGGGAWTALRSRIAQRVMAGLPGSPGAVAATLLTGLGTAIPPADRAAFQDSGLAHLLAVAGLHIGIVMGLVFAATRFGLAAWEHAALHWPTRQIAALAALAAGAGYLALTGAHVPIIRSFAMAALVTLGVLTGRRAISLRGLALAAVVLLVLAPESVVGVSLQMSFSAVLTLVAGYELARPVFARLAGGQWWRRPVLYAVCLVLTSLLAGTASLPFAAYHFGRATMYYVPANMLAVPLTALWVMPWGLAALALMPVGLEHLALVPMGLGIRGLETIAHGVASWPDAVMDIGQMPAWSPALVAAGLAWAGLWRGWLRLGGLLPLAVGLAAPLLVQSPDVLMTPQAGLIAVRAGDRTLVQAAHGVSAFTAAAPGRVWGGGPGEPWPDEAGPHQAGTNEAGAICTRNACRVGVRGRALVMAFDRQGVDCTAALVVSAASLGNLCGNGIVVDRAAAAAGAAEIWVSANGVAVRTDRMIRGFRPWVDGGRQELPAALTE